MPITVIHGPNLNRLGVREPDVYGTVTLEQINARILDEARRLDLSVSIFQSNSEGEIIDRIQALTDRDALVINPGAYTHTSVAIRDAIAGSGAPAVEVHLTNIHAREDFRRVSLVAPVCRGQISGFGPESYLLALAAAARLLRRD